MRREKREVLVNLMSYALVRASNISEEKIRDGVRRILGHNDFDPEVGPVEQQVVRSYVNQFQRAGCYVSAVRIRSLDEPSIYFNLIHITRNWRGLLEMKRAMRKNVRLQEEKKQESQLQMMLPFIEEFDNQMSAQAYAQHILGNYAGAGETGFVDFVTKELQSSPFEYAEIKDVLNELQKSKTISIVGGSSDYTKQDFKTRIVFHADTVQRKSEQLKLF